MAKRPITLPRRRKGDPPRPRCGDYGHVVRDRETGERRPCRKATVPGATVCTRHGGGAPQVVAAAERRQRETLLELIDPERVLRSMAELAYFDLRSMFDAGGNLLPVSQWPDGIGTALAGIETVKRNLDHADGVVDEVVKIKPYDKLKALEMLAKHLGLLTERVEHSGGLEVSWKGEE